MDLDFKRLVEWFGLHGAGGRLIEASTLPADIDIDRMEWDGSAAELKRLLSKVRMPSRRSYHLGSVTTGVFGMQSSARHRVVRGRGGTTWKMYVSGPDFPDGEEYMDELRSNDILSEVEYLGYQVSLRQWISMGWRPNT